VAASNQLATEIRSGRRSSGCLGLTALLHKAEMSFNRRSPVGYLTRSKNWLTVVVCSFPAMDFDQQGWGQWKILRVPRTDNALARGRDSLQLKVTLGNLCVQH